MDGYKIVNTIGRGNFGVVYLVECKADNRPYVMKQISMSELSTSEREGALQEVQLLSRLQHPFIVSYRASWLDNEKNVLYLVMQYCEGGDLTNAIKKKIQENQAAGKVEYFSEAEVLDWFVQLCLALRYCHQNKIIHRDLKSQNVFLTKNRAVRLGDFGIARVLNGTSELAMSVVGTPYSMSPEVCENKPYSYSSDIWALGCVLYEMCTLKHAFDANNLLGLVWKIVQEQCIPIPSCFSTELNNLVSKMLQKNPSQRPTIDQIINENIIKNRLQAQIQMKLKAKQEKQQLQVKSVDNPTPLPRQISNLSTNQLPVSTPINNINDNYNPTNTSQSFNSSNRSQEALESGLSPAMRMKLKKEAEAERRRQELNEAVSSKSNNPNNNNFNISNANKLSTQNPFNSSNATPTPHNSYNSYGSNIINTTSNNTPPNTNPADRPIKSSGQYHSNNHNTTNPLATMSPQQIKEYKQQQATYNNTHHSIGPTGPDSHSSYYNNTSNNPLSPQTQTSQSSIALNNSQPVMAAYTSNSGLIGDDEYEEDFEPNENNNNNYNNNIPNNNYNKVSSNYSNNHDSNLRGAIPNHDNEPINNRNSNRNSNNEINNSEEYHSDYEFDHNSDNSGSYSADHSDNDAADELNELEKTFKSANINKLGSPNSPISSSGNIHSNNSNSSLSASTTSNNNNNNNNNSINHTRRTSNSIQAVVLSSSAKLAAMKQRLLQQMSQLEFDAIYNYIKQKQASSNPAESLSKSELLAKFGANSAQRIQQIEQYIFLESINK